MLDCLLISWVFCDSGLLFWFLFNWFCVFTLFLFDLLSVVADRFWCFCLGFFVFQFYDVLDLSWLVRIVLFLFELWIANFCCLLWLAAFIVLVIWVCWLFLICFVALSYVIVVCLLVVMIGGWFNFRCCVCCLFCFLWQSVLLILWFGVLVCLFLTCI